MNITRNLIVPLAITSLLYIASCSSESKSNQPDTREIAKGKTVYTQYCQLCHGADGKLALNGAKDITVSALTLEERMELIKNGRNLMTPFNGILSEEEIRAVAAYTTTMQ